MCTRTPYNSGLNIIFIEIFLTTFHTSYNSSILETYNIKHFLHLFYSEQNSSHHKYYLLSRTRNK